jgi:hypothetical protein
LIWRTTAFEAEVFVFLIWPGKIHKHLLSFLPSSALVICKLALSSGDQISLSVVGEMITHIVGFEF